MAVNVKNIMRLQFFYTALLFLLLSSCSGGSFHLRESVSLSGLQQAIAIQGIPPESSLYIALEEVIAEADGEIVPLAKAGTIVQVTKLKEGKKVVAYTENRIAREYLVFLRFNYQLKKSGKTLGSRQISLDKTLIYDSNFVLGKVEEERRILQSLREEAVRLILLRLQYSEQ